MRKSIGNKTNTWTVIGLSCAIAISETAGATTITLINKDDPGEGYNDPGPPDPASTSGGNTGTTLGAQRLIAFQFAADLWAAQVVSTVEITVDTGFLPLPCTATAGPLGLGGPITNSRDFPGAPLPNTWYPAPLANALSGSDGTPPPDLRNDMRARFNSAFGVDTTVCPFPGTWYYGIDRNPPSGTVDFPTVALHELGHGLGFATDTNLLTGVRQGDPPGFNNIYETFLENHATAKLVSNMTDAERVAAFVSGPSLHWVGPRTVACGNSALSAGRDPATGHIEVLASLNPARPGVSVGHWSTTLVPGQLMDASTHSWC